MEKVYQVIYDFADEKTTKSDMHDFLFYEITI